MRPRRTSGCGGSACAAGTFTVTDGPRADGVQHSDGAAATSVPLPGYPRGMLVLHDGENTPDGGRVSTNFKYVDWRAIR